MRIVELRSWSFPWVRQIFSISPPSKVSAMAPCDPTHFSNFNIFFPNFPYFPGLGGEALCDPTQLNSLIPLISHISSISRVWRRGTVWPNSFSRFLIISSVSSFPMGEALWHNVSRGHKWHGGIHVMNELRWGLGAWVEKNIKSVYNTGVGWGGCNWSQELV